MTKKKGIVSKLLLLVVLLTLISCCFLGSTFARYTSSGSGTASMTVAKWDIKSTWEGSTSVDFGKLSPSMDKYEDTVRTNSTGRTLVATITNSGDVDALVTLAVGEPTLTNSSESNWGSYSEDIIKGLFSVEFYTTKTADAADSATLYTGEVGVEAGETLYVYAVVTWTSDDENVKGAAADARDTWVGANITSVVYTISYTAVQNSELPNNN